MSVEYTECRSLFRIPAVEKHQSRRIVGYHLGHLEGITCRSEVVNLQNVTSS